MGITFDQDNPPSDGISSQRTESGERTLGGLPTSRRIPAREAPRPIRVVVGEDSYVIREFLTAALRDAASLDLVAVCTNGNELEKAIETWEPEVVVTDIRMPKMDGICLADAVEALYPQIPVLFISGYPFDLEVEQLKHPAKSCGFLKKPFLPQPLFEAVRKCLAVPSQAATA